MPVRRNLKRTLLTSAIACTMAIASGAILAAPVQSTGSSAAASRPWMNTSLTPDQRAALLTAAMNQDEKFRLIRSDYGADFEGKHNKPVGSKSTAGFIPAMPRLGLPAIHETDAGQGVARPLAFGDGDTALPAGLAAAASFDPQAAYAGGAMIGSEAHRLGFNVLLAGGVDLVRDPRNGRNFEYAGEDPLLAGTIVGAAIRGIQSQHVVSTIKHYALNDLETARNTLSANIDRTRCPRVGPAGIRDRYRRWPARLGDVLLQPAQQRLRLRERLAAQQGAQAGLGLPGLRDVRLGRGAQRGQGGQCRAGPGIGRRAASTRRCTSTNRCAPRWPTVK